MDHRSWMAVRPRLVQWLRSGIILSHAALQALIAAEEPDESVQQELRERLIRQGWLESLPSADQLYHAGEAARRFAEHQGWTFALRTPAAQRWSILARATDVAISVALGSRQATRPTTWTWQAHHETADGLGVGVGMLRYARQPAVATDRWYDIQVVIYVDDGRLTHTQIAAAARQYGRALRQAASSGSLTERGWIALWMTPTPHRAGILWEHWIAAARCPLWIGAWPPADWQRHPGWAWHEHWWRDEQGEARSLNPDAPGEWERRMQPCPPPRTNPWRS